MASRAIKNAADFGTVAVLMGGVSAEREISLKSGAAVVSALERKGVDAIGIDVGPNPLKSFGKKILDRAFIMLHGRGGEDGVIQGLLESINLPYTGSGVLGSALAMDKLKTKLVWKGAEIPTPASFILRDVADLERCEQQIEFPVIVKPALEGSSFGMNKATNRVELENAWHDAIKYGCEVFAEEWVEGREYTVGILHEAGLPLIRLETPREFYDYDAKYRANSTRYVCPCGLDESTEKFIQDMALNAANILGVTGWGRADLMLDKHDQPWFIEVNTVPGMTDHSLVPMAAKVENIGFDDLVWRILETSFESGA